MGMDRDFRCRICLCVRKASSMGFKRKAIGKTTNGVSQDLDETKREKSRREKVSNLDSRQKGRKKNVGAKRKRTGVPKDFEQAPEKASWGQGVRVKKGPILREKSYLGT